MINITNTPVKFFPDSFFSAPCSFSFSSLSSLCYLLFVFVLVELPAAEVILLKDSSTGSFPASLVGFQYIHFRGGLK
jgi:hypothetical protein